MVRKYIAASTAYVHTSLVEEGSKETLALSISNGLGLPGLDVLSDLGHSLLGSQVSAQNIQKLSLGIHEVEEDGMVDKVVLALFDVGRGREVDSVGLAGLLDLVVSTSETENLGMELGKVLLQNLRRVSGRITGDEQRLELVGVALVDLVNHDGHLVELIGTNIGTHGKSKVQKRKLALEILTAENTALVVLENKGASNERLSVASVGLGLSSLGHLGLFATEEPVDTHSGNHKQSKDLEIENALVLSSVHLAGRSALGDGDSRQGLSLGLFALSRSRSCCSRLLLALGGLCGVPSLVEKGLCEGSGHGCRTQRLES